MGKRRDRKSKMERAEEEKNYHTFTREPTEPVSNLSAVTVIGGMFIAIAISIAIVALFFPKQPSLSSIEARIQLAMDEIESLKQEISNITHDLCQVNCSNADAIFGTVTASTFINSDFHTTLPFLMYGSYSNVTVANTLEPQTLIDDEYFIGSTIFKSNSLTTGTIIRLNLGGFFSTMLNNPSIQWKITLGNLTLIDTDEIVYPCSAVNDPWTLSAFFRIGLNNTILGEAILTFSDITLTPPIVMNVNDISLPIPALQNKGFDVIVEWKELSPLNSVTCTFSEIIIYG